LASYLGIVGVGIGRKKYKAAGKCLPQSDFRPYRDRILRARRALHNECSLLHIDVEVDVGIHPFDLCDNFGEVDGFRSVELGGERVMRMRLLTPPTWGTTDTAYW